ncbi:MAG: thiamine phosphate synthase [Methanomassiliicoccaceae archaeon]|nr:thiamine phosphate synthase [Methanomassiliicoccaceae archaeon]
MMVVAVTDRRISAPPVLTDQIRRIAAARPDMMILREKDLSEREYERLAAECKDICDRFGVKFCINSFTGTAVALGCGRIQLPFALLGSSLSDFEEIWVSVHSIEEALVAERAGATHLIYGNVFETSCKPDLGGKGIDDLRAVCESVSIPVLAIGGMDAVTAPAVIAAGCVGVCIRSSLMTADDPDTVIKKLRASIAPRV